MKQSLTEAVDELVSIIKTGMPEFNLVSKSNLHEVQIAAGEYPACIVIIGGEVRRHNVTSTVDSDRAIGITIYGEGGDSQDTMLGYYEKLTDLLELNLNLNNKANLFISQSSGQPFAWENVEPPRIDITYMLTYRRDKE